MVNVKSLGLELRVGYSARMGHLLKHDFLIFLSDYQILDNQKLYQPKR